MEFNMNEIEQLLNAGYYSKVYERLFQTKDEYSLDFLCGKHLVNVDASKKFSYLNYALARKENVEIHIFICYYLLYGDCLFDDIHTVVNWHFRRSLEISNNKEEVLKEILINYKEHPDSPFSKEEIKNYEDMLGTQ
jgi:hypothetical protein